MYVWGENVGNVGRSRWKYTWIGISSSRESVVYLDGAACGDSNSDGDIYI